MGAQKSSLPVFKDKMFAFEKRQEYLEFLVPEHLDAEPTPDIVDNSLWGVQGLETIDSSSRVLLVANIGDVVVPDPQSETGERTIPADEVAAFFVSARYGKLSEEFPDLDLHRGDEVFPVLPHSALMPVYQEGQGGPPAGQTATNGSVEIVPIPITVAA